MRRFERYVALGDSTTEGLDDEDGAGGYRGWANRLAEHLAAQQGSIRYANLGVRGKGARQVRDEQLAAALALRPDLATVVAGMNDLLRVGFDARAIAEDIGAMQRALIASGASVLTFTIPDLSGRLAPPPLAAPLSRRTLALDEEIRRVSRATGAILVDLAALPHAVDPRFWSRDRLHANAEGHRRTAAALAHAIGVPVDPAWDAPLPPEHRSLRVRLAEHTGWARDYMLPWLWGRVRGRSAGDARGPKLPMLTEIKIV